MASDHPRHAAGALGPRLAGRLTAELILRSPQYMNPLKQYEIDLRGNKIAAIENLGATENQFDSIDLSDNAIGRLEGFPKLNRLKLLLLNNNRITRISKNCHEPIPNLEVLMLTNNRLSNLQDLEPLSGFTQLTILSLLGNPVIHKPNYRLFMISRCKSLKILDFKKVKQQERDAAARLFPTEEAAAAHSAKTFEVDADFEAQTKALQQQQQQEQQQAAEAQPAAAKKGPAPEQIIAVKAAIANAQTMDEIRRLEEALTTGHLPSEFVVQGQRADAPAETKPVIDGKADTDMTDANTADQDKPVAESNGSHVDGNKPEDMAVG